MPTFVFTRPALVLLCYKCKCTFWAAWHWHLTTRGAHILVSWVEAIVRVHSALLQTLTFPALQRVTVCLFRPQADGNSLPVLSSRCLIEEVLDSVCEKQFWHVDYQLTLFVRLIFNFKLSCKITSPCPCGTQAQPWHTIWKQWNRICRF